jgi:hypothetical protein
VVDGDVAHFAMLSRGESEVRVLGEKAADHCLANNDIDSGDQ